MYRGALTNTAFADTPVTDTSASGLNRPASAPDSWYAIPMGPTDLAVTANDFSSVAASDDVHSRNGGSNTAVPDVVTNVSFTLRSASIRAVSPLTWRSTNSVCGIRTKTFDSGAISSANVSCVPSSKDESPANVMVTSSEEHCEIPRVAVVRTSALTSLVHTRSAGIGTADPPENRIDAVSCRPGAGTPDTATPKTTSSRTKYFVCGGRTSAIVFSGRNRSTVDAAAADSSHRFSDAVTRSRTSIVSSFVE